MPPFTFLGIRSGGVVSKGAGASLVHLWLFGVKYRRPRSCSDAGRLCRCFFLVLNFGSVLPYNKSTSSHNFPSRALRTKLFETHFTGKEGFQALRRSGAQLDGAIEISAKCFRLSYLSRENHITMRRRGIDSIAVIDLPRTQHKRVDIFRPSFV